MSCGVQGEEYARLARQLQIWPFPRGHHRNVVVLPYKGSVWLLADARFCPLLPEQLRLQPPGSLQAVAGRRGASCDVTCRCVPICGFSMAWHALHLCPVRRSVTRPTTCTGTSC